MFLGPSIAFGRLKKTAIGWAMLARIRTLLRDLPRH